MAIEPIPVLRAAYLRLVMDVVPGSCEDRETALRQASLPASVPQDPSAYVPLMPALGFMSALTRDTDFAELLLAARTRLRLGDFGAELAARVQAAPSLAVALREFCTLADREQSIARYRLVREGDEVRILSAFDGVSASGARYCGEWLRILSAFDGVSASGARYCGEWLRILSLLTLIRRFAGLAWTPVEIALQRSREPAPAVRRAFPRTRFVTGRAETAVVFPGPLLRSACASHRPLPGRSRTAYRVRASDSPASWDFQTSLREVLQHYMSEGYPNIALAARIVGCSVRTLQRRLERCRVRYTDVVQAARFEAAKKMLRENDGKVIDTAYSVGYSDPSHFARAFRRLSGLTPRQYRRLSSMAA